VSDLDFNPYRAPQSDLRVDNITDGSIDDLRNVVRWQRTLTVCLLTIVVAIAIQFAMLNLAVVEPTVALYLVTSMAAFLSFVIGAFTIFRLSARLWGTILGLILAILTLAPPLGLIIAVVVHVMATRLLKAHRVKVGLLWTDPVEVDRRAGFSH
jgi:hypothetical protein